MNDRDKIVIRHDDLDVMINAIENMQRSLNLLSSSLAGMIPEQILPAQLPLIAGNLISYCLPDIPYNIYAGSEVVYCAEKEAAIRRLLLLIPAVTPIITDSLEPVYIEIRIDWETAEENVLLGLRFSKTVTDSEKKRFGEHWEKLPESIRDEFTYRFSYSGNSSSLTIIPMKK